MAISQLSKQGVEVKIDNIDLNLFTGEFRLEGLKDITKKDNTNLQLKQFYIEFDWLPLLDKKIHINQIVIESFAVKINNQANTLKVAGISIPTSSDKKTEEKPQDEGSWYVSLKNVKIDDVKVNYQDDKLILPLQLTQLNVDVLDTQNIDGISTIALSLKLNDSLATFNIVGDVLNPNAFIKTDINITHFDFSPFKALLPKQVKLSKGSTKMTSLVELNLKDSKPLKLVHQGLLAVNNVEVFVDGNQIVNEQIKWQGRNEINFTTDGMLTINNSGVLSNQSLQLTQAVTGTVLKLKALAFDGNVALNNDNLMESIKVLANIELFQLTVEAANKKQRVLMETFTVEQLKTNGINKLNIKNVQIKNLALLDDAQKKALYKSENLVVKQIALLDKNNLTINLVEQTSQTANINKNKQAVMNVQQFITSFVGTDNKQNADTVEAKPVVKATKFTFNIKTLKLNGENIFSYQDLSLTPTFKKAVKLDELLVKNINNSSQNQVITYNIVGKILPSSPYSIVGDITPFADKLSLNTKIKTEGIGLLEYSSFILPVTGYQIESGEADTDLDIKIKNNVVDAKNKITLHQLELLESDPKTAKKLNSTISMPMHKALDLLRDDNNTIILNIPLKGELDSLSVNPNDTINLALGNALKSGSKVYIATALFPYGTIYTLVKIAGEKINAIKLKSIKYKAGVATLSVKDKDYLNKVAGILKNKKQLRVRLCSKATASDKQQLMTLEKQTNKIDWHERLLTLANKRKITIENYLSTKHQIKPNKLIDCRTVIEKGKTAKPRVELLI